MTTQFDAASWQAASERTDKAREAWEQDTHSAMQAKPVTGDDGSPVDAVAKAQTTALHLKWYDLIGSAGVRLGSDASKMMATARNYSSTEAQAVDASKRFWEAT